MAGLGFKDFQVGEVLTSSDVDGYLMQQAVMNFANAGARGSALGTATGTAVPLAEGMVSYLQDTDTVEVYDGSAWVGVGNPAIGTAVVTATKTDVFTSTSSSYVDVTDLSVTITPTSATSKVLVIAFVNHSNASDGFRSSVRLIRDSTTPLLVGDVVGSRQAASATMQTDGSGQSSASTIVVVDSPATTSAVTYDVQIIANSSPPGTAVVNRITADADSSTTTRQASSITAIEVKA